MNCSVTHTVQMHFYIISIYLDSAVYGIRFMNKKSFYECAFAQTWKWCPYSDVRIQFCNFDCSIKFGWMCWASYLWFRWLVLEYTLHKTGHCIWSQLYICTLSYECYYRVSHTPCLLLKNPNTIINYLWKIKSIHIPDYVFVCDKHTHTHTDFLQTWQESENEKWLTSYAWQVRFWF